jgi:hypothetical protein
LPQKIKGKIYCDIITINQFSASSNIEYTISSKSSWLPEEQSSVSAELLSNGGNVNIKFGCIPPQETNNLNLQVVRKRVNSINYNLLNNTEPKELVE